MTDLPAGRGGPIALVGSGEYLAVMAPIDRLLLEQVGGPAAARVVVLATAAGLEPAASWQRWTHMGLDHFARLGAHVDAVGILTRADAFDMRWLAALERANFVYFSGGDPRYLIETLRDSPAWETIRGRHAAGAVLAGCSAGAMAFGACTVQRGALWTGNQSRDNWHPALGLLPGLIILPHFDRLAARAGVDGVARLAAVVPVGHTLIGIQEDTALVSLGRGQSIRWQVLGRQSVAIIDAEGGAVYHAAGEAVELA